MKLHRFKTGAFQAKITAPAALAALLVLAFLIAGCGGQQAGPDPAAVDVKFPDFVYRSEGALDSYRLAVAYADMLQYIPCYCGCKRDAEKYRSLKDCFIDRKTGDYNEHAAGCQICQDEAKDIGQWKQQGLSDKDIRQKIDEKYAGRGEPTDTPPPAG